MTRIAFIGAGSEVFTRTVIVDILTHAALKDSSHFVLMDINKKRLDFTRRIVERILKDTGAALR